MSLSKVVIALTVQRPLVSLPGSSWTPAGYDYDQIAQNRYQLFGKKEVCMLPSEALRKRFLEEIPA